MAENLNKKLFAQAKKYIPGGVNSPVRSFKAVGGAPIFIKKAKGAKIYDESGREFIDYCLGFGALILGHAHAKALKAVKSAVDKGTIFGAATKLETEFAQAIIKAIPAIKKIRLANSGTEAVMAAIRVSRAYTKKNKIIKFKGAYHGTADYLLNCPGVTDGFKKYTLIAPYDNIEELKKIIHRHSQDIAAIIIEPVAGNSGVVLPQGRFLKELSKITRKYGIILIFDEVITGFRFLYGGSQKLFGIEPDLTCLGKIIGGGLPIGAFGGRKEIMELLAPEGPVYQAGTFSGNPVSVSAGLAVLKVLKKTNPYARLEKLTRYLCAGIKQQAEKYKVKLKVVSIGPIFGFCANKDLFKKLYHGLLDNGVYLSPSRLEANFVSCAHTKVDIEKSLKAFDKTFKTISTS